MKIKIIICGVIAVFTIGLLIGQAKTISLQSERIETLMAVQESFESERETYEAALTKKDDEQASVIGSYDTLIQLLESRIINQDDQLLLLLKDEKSIIESNQIDVSNYINFYGYDDQAMNREVQFYLTDAYIENDNIEKSNVDKLTDVIQLLSDVYFGHLPIEVIKIESTDEGNIAYINLDELENAADYNDYYGWANGYFQGSTGGQVTVDVLTYNILQPDKSDWFIDGVKVYYKQETIDSFDHVPALADVVMRNELDKIK